MKKYIIIVLTLAIMLTVVGCKIVKVKKADVKTATPVATTVAK